MPVTQGKLRATLKNDEPGHRRRLCDGKSEKMIL